MAKYLDSDGVRYLFNKLLTKFQSKEQGDALQAQIDAIEPMIDALVQIPDYSNSA
jgi:hypothetical protein